LFPVCDDIDIRFDIAQFKKLEDCGSVEGSVKILSLNELKPKDFANISFPQLTEITDFLIIHEVSGLKSISNLFPNLVRIRGEKLFKDYAMVLYGNADLENIGLSNLRNISNGAIRIEHNEMLCFVNSVDWSRIQSENFRGKNYFYVRIFLIFLTGDINMVTQGG
jgi:hypothetical protein